MSLIKTKRAVGVFSSRQEIENALSELRDNGFDMNHVSVIAQDTEDLNQRYKIGETRVEKPTGTTHDTSHDTSHDTRHDTTRVEEGTKTGIGAGGAVGGLTGLLIGLGTLAIPGVGPIMLAGAAATAIATTLAGGAIGAAVGGLIGGLVGLGIPEHRAQVYNDYVVAGDYLVIVDGIEAEVLRAEKILKNRGMREWEVYNTPETSRHESPVVSRL